MIDPQVQILAEHLMAGQHVTPELLQRQLRCSHQHAVDLLTQATTQAEEFTNVRQIKKQAQINAQRQDERRRNRITNRRTGSYHRFR